MFTDEERVALEFATVMAANEGAEADELFERVRGHFDDGQIVELAFFVATLHGLNLFNNMLDIQPEDRPMFSQTALDEAAD